MDIKRIETTDSTNNWVALHENEFTEPTLAYCITQTEGRGQRGNSWESEPGKNITASLIFQPTNFPAARQFEISEAIALGLTEFLRTAGVDARIKWPNDIYVGDKKICGILVEHAVTGKNITRTIAGFGLNLNQTEFLSDAPNPISLKMLTGKDYDLKTAVEAVAFHLERYLYLLERFEPLHPLFMRLLWRYDRKLHKFHDKKLDEVIEARIAEVAPDGVLTLVTGEGEWRNYFFKEVEFILE